MLDSLFLLMGFIFLVFSSSDTEINYEVPQKIGGILVVEGVETDYYEACNYNIKILYKTSKAEFEIGY
ncbi:hypothetical protein [Algibacillus agarilyticus]|uniref:hypothetical protein n=1 Tax=Algibacillus agarilyticus TaxID=2234133 RepID=UPI000DCFF1E9|nr:hypothetical protein [Algibacillus agarilyticus]